MKVIILITSSFLSVFTLFLSMSSMVNVNKKVANDLLFGIDSYHSNIQINSELYMPFEASDRYDTNISFIDNYSIPFNGDVICMCCGHHGFKP